MSVAEKDNDPRTKTARREERTVATNRIELVTVYRDDLASRQLQIIDPFTGDIVPISGTLPSGTHPAWAPDGAHIAYVTNTDNWGGANTTGDIAVVPFAADSVGTQTIIHTGTSISGGRADSYPSWSPDSSAMQMFFASAPYQHVDHILLAGGCASIPGIDEVVYSRTQTSTLISNPFAKMAVSSHIKARQLAADAPALYVACGLALRMFDQS